MIRIDSGHLGSGDWKVKQQDGVTFLSHRLPFSPRNEYRIGCDEVIDVQIESIEKHKQRVIITFTEERLCSGLVDKQDLEPLLTMVNADQPAPLEDRNTNAWVKGIAVFVVATIVFEFFK
jgi:hypothetical protein